MSDSFDFESFLHTQIVIPTVENILQPLQQLYQMKPLSKTYEKDLMRDYLKFNKLTQQHLDVYNQFIKKSANIICSKVIPMDDGRMIHFDNLKFEKPYYNIKNTKRKLMPMYTRRHYMTYDSEWTVDLIIKKDNKIIYTSDKRVVIAKIPVMLFSMLCHLENKTAHELVELGEDPIEQGGYFIIVGVEKILMLEEKLSTNRIFIMNSSPKIKKYKTAMRLTSNTSKGTFLNEIIYNVNNVMKYSFQSLRKKNLVPKKVQFETTKKINIIYLFQLYSQLYLNNQYCNTATDIINLIKPFLVNERNINNLFVSIAGVSAINVGQKKPIGAKEVILKKMNVGSISDKEKIIEIKKLLFGSTNGGVFDHLEEIDKFENETEKAYEIRIVKAKVNLLAIMVAQYLNYLNGFTAMDDRDDWANKRLEGPGRKMEQLIRSSWNKVLKEVIDNVLRDRMANTEIEKNFHSGTISDTITKIFRDSFINSKWGIKGSSQKNNATQTLVRDNMLASLSHINTINVNIQRTDKNIAIHMVQLSQYRYVSYIESPDGSNCKSTSAIVILSNGREKAIGELKNGDEVMTIDPVTHQQSVSKIHSHFIKSSAEYGKSVLKITSINGRETICTDDHPFLTQRGWIYAKDLNMEKDKIVIYPSVKPLAHIDLNPTLIIDETIFRERLTALNVKSSLIGSHLISLKENNLLPLYTNDERMPILARIIGFMLADGTLFYSNQRFGSSYCFGTEYDGKLFQEDMKLLGYNENTLTYGESTIVDKKTGRISVHHAWRTAYGSSFASFLAALDLLYGDRVKKASNPIPEWIMQNSLAVKREFLAGFQGGDGSKISWTRREDRATACNLSFGHTIQHKIPEHIGSLIGFMNQLKDIFEELGVKILSTNAWVQPEHRKIVEGTILPSHDVVIKNWKTPEDNPMVELNISSTHENMIKYMDMIGYRYATTKSTHCYQASEYLRYKLLKIEERNMLKAQVLELHATGMKAYLIAREVNIRPRLVNSILEYERVSKHMIETLAPKDCMNYVEWLSVTFAKNNCVYMPLKSIEPAEHCMVSDFTTESDNHSFIANNYVTHNCGLVKNLTITTRLTLDRGIEGDRIIISLVSYTEERTLENEHVLMINSKYLGWCNGPATRTLLINARRNGDIYYDTSLFIDNQYLWIDASPSRLLSPVLIVDLESQKLVLDLKEITDLTPENLIREGAMEYISAWEEQNLKIAMDIKHLYNRKEQLDKLLNQLPKAREELDAYVEQFGDDDSKQYNLLLDAVALLEVQKAKFDNNKPFTHCEVSGRAALGVAADMIPFMQHNQAPRNIYQCLWEEEPVLMADGTRKMIKDVKVGDMVMTFDPETMISSTTAVVNQYVRPTDKVICRVTTTCGRKIIATEDHKFMTNEGWCKVKDLADKLVGVTIDNNINDLRYKFVPIESIEVVENCIIADITTASENHSFVGGEGFMVHNSAMGKQAVGNYHLNHRGRFDGTVKVLESATPPIVKTDMYDTLGLSERGMGQNVIVAFVPLPDNEEDSFIFNQGSVDRGMFRMVKYFNIQGKVKISNPNVKSWFGKPTKLKPDEDPSIYENLNEHGIPIIGSVIKPHQAVLSIIKEKNGIQYNCSIYLNEGETGIVDDVLFHETFAFEIINVKLRITRTPKQGWKFAARMAQKGTVGRIVPYEDMMFEESTGITPDIIVNTTVIPSRMTISYLMELITGKAAAMYGETVDASAFQQVDMDKYKEMLRHIGFNTEGYSKMRDGITGQVIETEIYTGVVYFTALKHQPEDKINVRSVGPVNSTTRQPIKGRQHGGGLRIGGMEVDTFISHGASATIKERLCDVSDKYTMAICKPCGITSVYNEIEKKFYCPSCDESDVGALTIPYVNKYQGHLLAPIGIKIGYVVGSKPQPVYEDEDVEEEENEEEDEEEESEDDLMSEESEEDEEIDDDVEAVEFSEDY